MAQAKQSGAVVVAYDRLITNTPDVDYYIAFDNFKVGVLQGQALLDGMKAKKPNGPYTIELFSGSPDDNNSKVFFDGAMSVLQPAIDSGDVVVGSQQTAIKQTATQGWKRERPVPDGLAAELGLQRGQEGTGRRALAERHPGPGDHHLGQGGREAGAGGHRSGLRVESVKSIMAGEQYSTINKDTRKLVASTITMVKALQAGDQPEINDTKSYDNGVKVVPSFLLDPVIVTKENAAEAYANDPTLGPLTQ